jgi:hypothetical protein
LEGDIKIDLKTCDKRMKDWINLAQDRNRWRAIMNTAMNIWVTKMLGNSWLDE